MTEHVAVGSIGRWTDEYPFLADRSRIAEYAAATNETDERHLSGDLGSPLFAMIPIREALAEARLLSMPLGVPEGALRLHGEQAIEIQRPIAHGDVLWSKAAPVGIVARSKGTLIVYRTVTRDDRGSTVNRQIMSAFVRGLHSEQSIGEPFPSPDAPVPSRPPSEVHVERTDADQPHRYSAAATDPTRFHLDDAYARSVGLPGVIVQGLCTMAFVARAIVAARGDGDSVRLRRMGLRFSAPLLPAKELKTRLWDVAGEPGARHVRFDAESEGKTVVAYGLADLDSEA